MFLETPTYDVASFDCTGFEYISALIFAFLGRFRTQVGKMWYHFWAP